MARHRWAARTAPPRPDASRPRPFQTSTPEYQVRRHTCGLCGRAAKSFGYVHGLRFEAFPRLAFCSMGCCEAGGALAMRSGGVSDRTPMEARAVKDARRPFAEALAELGLLAPFHDRSAAEIDRVIEACVDGFQDSMRRQAEALDPMADPIPL